MKPVAQICLIWSVLFVTAQRLPAPIVEETPKPAPEQSAKPKAKPTKPKASESAESPRRSPFVASKNAPASDRKLFWIPQSQITATATSQHPGYEARNAVDGDTNTIWHTPFGLFGPEISLPQSIILNLGGAYNVSRLRYLPRQDSGFGSLNGNILTYRIYASTDGNNFTQIAAGNWSDDHAEKNTTFGPTRASYLRLEAVAAHGGHASAAELNVAVTQ
ncbi:MAG: hypothetical protein DME90_10330 [Verrucomicrobia bacterium]|nr:MAG: hypothetical protein DME90_10330 [Verrucomicrobiota bacterium]